jgi:uncharacterized protein YbjQ (UPF0145 family)
MTKYAQDFLQVNESGRICFAGGQFRGDTIVPITNQEPAMLQADRSGLALSNTESIPGKTIVEFYGVVSGNTVRAKHIGRDIMAGLKNIVGGELVGYTELLQDSRQEALDRMVEQARSMGANAVVNIRFATSSISQGAAELFAYGTAVKVA